MTNVVILYVDLCLVCQFMYAYKYLLKYIVSEILSVCSQILSTYKVTNSEKWSTIIKFWLKRQ